MVEKIYCTSNDLSEIFFKEKLSSSTLLINKLADKKKLDTFIATGDRGILSEDYNERGLLSFLISQDGSVYRSKRSKEKFKTLEIVINSTWIELLKNSKIFKQIEMTEELSAVFGKLKSRDMLLQGSEVIWLILPWEDAKHLTIVLIFKDAQVDDYEELIIKNILSFPIPDGLLQAQLDEKVIHLAEYDFIYSPSYVGKDRRKNPDGNLFDKYTFRGRRRLLPKSTGGRYLGFTDRLSPTLKFLFCVYILFSSVDTYLSVKFIAYGHLSEVNPILKPLLVGKRVWLFSLFKNIFSLSFFAVISRFERSSLGLAVAVLNVLLYVLLSIYWLFILLKTHYP